MLESQFLNRIGAKGAGKIAHNVYGRITKDILILPPRQRRSCLPEGQILLK